MATVSLNASSRNDLGKGAARKIRAQGLLPAVIYRAGQSSTTVSLDPNELETAFRRSGNRNTLVSIGVDGKTFTCLVKATQRDPVTANLIHVDFYEVDADVEVMVRVPVKPTGKAIGVTAGGKLRLIRRDLDVRCKPDSIPASVNVDVSKLNIGDFVRVSTVPAPAGAEIVAPNDFNILTVVGKRGARVAVEEEPEEGAEAVDGGGAVEAEGSSEEAGE